ncbi:MAG: hypothetical protein QOJ95_2917 [Mycobacterium sp.]|nr:hypothetical protein [Mycobacterium sp.]
MTRTQSSTSPGLTSPQPPATGCGSRGRHPATNQGIGLLGEDGRHKHTGEEGANTPEEKERALLAVQKYLGDLCFVTPGVFPSGQDVQHLVGQILGMWE